MTYQVQEYSHNNYYGWQGEYKSRRRMNPALARVIVVSLIVLGFLAFYVWPDLFGKIVIAASTIGYAILSILKLIKYTQEAVCVTFR